MIARAACGLGIGLVAGVVGTAAITVSQRIAMRIQGRKPSGTPAKAVKTVLDVQPVTEGAESRLNELAHWSYGTAWGAARGVMSAFGLQGVGATMIHWGAVQGTAMLMLPGLKVAPPVREWGASSIAWEGFHHAVYVTTVGLTADALCRSLGAQPSRGRIPWQLLLGGISAAGVRQLSNRPGSRVIDDVQDRARDLGKGLRDRLPERQPVGAGRS